VFVRRPEQVSGQAGARPAPEPEHARRYCPVDGPPLAAWEKT
jgi:hypothetical protein